MSDLGGSAHTHAMRKDWARHALSVARTTLVGGVVFMMPVVVLIVVFAKAGGYLRKLAQPLEKMLPLDKLYGVIVADAILIALFFLACFGAGLLMRLSFANSFIKKAETGLLWRIPGYGFLKALPTAWTRSTAPRSARCSFASMIIPSSRSRSTSSPTGAR